MSLPHALKLKLSDLPGEIPYLYPEPTRVAKWQDYLQKLPKPWVAICWAGRPTHFNDANRSLNLNAFTSLMDNGATFISIQKGPATKQLEAHQSRPNLMNLDSLINDFEDTAAILSLCDLLISVDSSPVHLAGAVGCPAWVMLPFVPDWRWLINRSDTPWYPGHRLYRQAKIGDWDSVISAIRHDLNIVIADKSDQRKI
jgi:ADP-heptose:LPS heptosyltransferase